MNIYHKNYGDQEGCVYLTLYKGKLMPNFYIGSVYIKRIFKENYHGSVVSQKYKDVWKQELKEHPELFETKIVIRGISRNRATDIEEILHRYLDVVNSPYYINMATSRGSKFSSVKGRIFTEQHCKNISKAQQKLLLDEEERKRRGDSNRNKKGLWSNVITYNEEVQKRMTIEKEKRKKQKDEKIYELDEKTRFAISQKLKNKKKPPRTKEHSKNLSKAKIGLRSNDPKCRKILCIELGICFTSVRQASIYVKGNSSNITKCASGGQRSSYGYTWVFIKE